MTQERRGSEKKSRVVRVLLLRDGSVPVKGHRLDLQNVFREPGLISFVVLLIGTSI